MKRDGGPAFPTFVDTRVYRDKADRVGHFAPIPAGGMSLRDYFAGQALAGLIARTPLGELSYDDVVSDSYDAADRMLAEREKGQ